MRQIYLAITKFLIPFGLGALLCFFVYLIGRGRYAAGREAYWTLYGMMLAGFPGGRWSLSMGIAAGFDPLLIIGIGAAADGIVALWVLWNWRLLYKIPKLGGWIESAKKKGEKFFKEHPGIEKGSFFGLAAFVASPIQVGGFYSSVVSRLIGIRIAPAFGAILLGSFLGGILVVYSTKGLLEAIKLNLFFTLLVIGLVVAGVLVYYWLKRSKEGLKG
jgi:uncharacterized membrane protein